MNQIYLHIVRSMISVVSLSKSLSLLVIKPLKNTLLPPPYLFQYFRCGGTDNPRFSIADKDKKNLI